MTVIADYEVETADLLHDPNHQYWSTTQLDRYINAARVQLVKDTGCLRTYQTAYTTQGQEAITFGQVTGALINSGGTGYVAPTISFSGGGGSGVAATLGVTSGAVTSISFTSFGSGYSSAPTPLILGTPGGVTTVTMATPGVGYTSIPTIGFSGGGGSGAAATANLAITNFTFAGGAGYAVGEVITGAAGTFFTPVKVVVATIGGGGAVTTVQFIQHGDYSVLPGAASATTSNGAGTGFTLTPQTLILSSATITNGGSGYTSAPTATVTLGGATVQGTYSVTITAAGTVASISIGVLNVNTYDILSVNLIWGAMRIPLRWRDFSTFSAIMRSWVAQERQPAMWAMYGDNQLYIGPLPDQSYQIEVDTVILPIAISGSTVDPIPTVAQSPIAYYAAHIAKFNDQRYGEAETFRKKYLELMSSVANAYTRRIPDIVDGLK